MEAPAKGLTPEEFQEAIRSHQEKYYTYDGANWRCNECNSVIAQTTCWVSMHAKEFGDQHAGDGEIRRFPLPFCPRCEGEPRKKDTCVHIEMVPTATVQGLP